MRTSAKEKGVIYIAERSRKWLLTIFLNDIVKEGFNFFEVLHYDVVIVSPLHHEPSPHYHLIIQHGNAISFNTLKNIFMFAHIDKQFGTNIQAYNYLFHKDDVNKEELSEEDVKANIDIKNWLNGVVDKEDIAKDLFNAIEESSYLWQVIRRFPNLWRDVSKIKDLWNIYRVYNFAIHNINVKSPEKEIDIVERKEQLSADDFYNLLNQPSDEDLK